MAVGHKDRKGKVKNAEKDQGERHSEGEGNQVKGGEVKSHTSNYVLNVDSQMQQLQAHLPPGRATDRNLRYYNPSKPTVCKIWSDSDLHSFFPAQLSVMLEPAILPNGSEYHGLVVFPELVKPRPNVPPKAEAASSSSPTSIPANEHSKTEAASTTPVHDLPTVGSLHMPQWTYLASKQEVMHDALLLASDECSQMFAARQNTEDICARKKESQLFGLDEECIPDPYPFLAVAEGRDKEFQNTADTLEFNILYTDHSTTLTVGAAIAETTTMADFVQFKMTEISLFFKSRGLPAFDENKYSYFFVPGAGGTTFLAEWAVQPNAAVVFLPKSRANEGYYNKCQSIPELKKGVEALMAKVRFQVKMLKTIHQTLHPFWLAIAAERHCSSWKQLNGNGPSAFYKILRASMLAAEKASVEIEETLHQPLSRLQRAALKNRNPEQLLEKARMQVAGLLVQETISSSQLSRLQQQMDASPVPLGDKEITQFKNEVQNDNHRYRLKAGPMFKVWGRSFVPYVRKRIMADVTVASKGHIPFPNLDHFSFPNTCGPDWNQTLEVIRSDAAVMHYLEKLGMTARLLELTKTDSWDRMTLLSPVDQTPTTAIHLAIGGHEVCHHVTDEEKAAAITSPALMQYRVPLEKLLRFRRRHSHMSGDIDLDKMATLFFKGASFPASTSRADLSVRVGQESFTHLGL